MYFLCLFTFYSAGVYDECDHYDVTTDADADVENDDDVPAKRQHKRKADYDFLHPSQCRQGIFTEELSIYFFVASSTCTCYTLLLS